MKTATRQKPAPPVHEITITMSRADAQKIVEAWEFYFCHQRDRCQADYASIVPALCRKLAERLAGGAEKIVQTGGWNAWVIASQWAASACACCRGVRGGLADAWAEIVPQIIRQSPDGRGPGTGLLNEEHDDRE